MSKSAVAKPLTSKQREQLLSAPKEHLYVVYGSITNKWWVQYNKIDKYLGGYDTKEQAEEIIKTGAYLDEDARWYSGNTLVL